MKLRLILFLLALYLPQVKAQGPTRHDFIYVASDPVGACSNGQSNQFNYLTGTESGCVNGTWTAVSGGGGGTCGTLGGVINGTCAATTFAPSPTFTGTVNSAGATHTLPMIVVANVPALPATCTAGELAVVTAATPGQQIYQCSAGNIWTQQLNSGSATGGGITVYSGTGLTVTANTYYLPIGGGGSPSTTETNVDVDSPSAATITNFYVQQNVAIGAGNTATYTWRKNGVSQSVTCQIAGASATSCSDTTHSFSVSQGDLLTIQLVTTGTIVVTPNITMAVQFGNITATGSVNNGTANQLAYYASSGTAVSGTNAAPNGTTATTQTTGDGSTKLANDAFIANALQSINPATNVQVSTTAVLPNTPTYSNGTAGVGATLTAGSNTTLAAIDGYTVQLTDRVLIKNQATTANNGVYTLTATGSGSAPWVLTRAADYNSVTNINYTGFICTIQTGSTFPSDTCFSLDNLITAVGTSALTYTQQATGASASKPGGGVQIIGNVTAGDALKVASGASGKNIQDAGVAFSSLTQTIASGAKALATGAISSAACTSAQTDTATGTLTTDAIIATFNGDPTAVTGYVPLTTGMLTIIPYPTSNTVNFKVCNNTSASITPGAITINWRVVR